jgi:hypothetical protein
MSTSNGADVRTSELMVVVRIDDQINEALTGHAGNSYARPPQPREQALALVQVLLGYTNGQLDSQAEWSCPIAGGRRRVAVKPATGSREQVREPHGQRLRGGRCSSRTDDVQPARRAQVTRRGVRGSAR